MEECIICSAEVDGENASVLEMGGYGNPKYLCTECSLELDTLTLDRDTDNISLAMSRITKKIGEADLSSKTFATITSILEQAAERAKAIKNGTYDFSLDEAESEGEGFDEIPEELRETEEDIELDRQDEEKAEKFNQFFDYVSMGVVIGIVIFAVWKILDIFVL